MKTVLLSKIVCFLINIIDNDDNSNCVEEKMMQMIMYFVNSTFY